MSIPCPRQPIPIVPKHILSRPYYLLILMSTLDPSHHHAHTSVHAHVMSIPCPSPLPCHACLRACPNLLHACALLPMPMPCLCLCPPSPDPCPCHDCIMPLACAYSHLMPVSTFSPCPCLCTSMAHVYSMIVTMPMSVFCSAPHPCCVVSASSPALCFCHVHAHATPRPFPPRVPLHASAGRVRAVPTPLGWAAASRMCACHSSRERRLLPPIHVTCVCLSFSLCVTARGRERARHGEREEEGGSFK